MATNILHSNAKQVTAQKSIDSQAKAKLKVASDPCFMLLETEYSSFDNHLGHKSIWETTGYLLGGNIFEMADCPSGEIEPKRFSPPTLSIIPSAN